MKRGPEEAHDVPAYNDKLYPVLEHIQRDALIKNNYNELYQRSITDPKGFWAEKAREFVDWFSPFTEVTSGGFEEGDIAWFLNGKLNVCYNCVDRHLPTKKDQVAIIQEGDDGQVKKVTYSELHKEVCRLANALKRQGVKRGDAVCIYLPMIPEAAYAMLACARIGAVHSVVFAGFSSEALSSRIQDSECRILITCDESKRGGKHFPLKKYADEALRECPSVKTVFVVKNTGADVHIATPRDVWYHEAMANERPYCPCEIMDSEDVLFLLYTSGSTGKPKGVLHTQAGYLLYVTMTHKFVFDYRPGDVYACVADVGWITGHSYIIYGPLSNGATTLMFESVPTYPDPTRYWSLIERHNVSIFYTAPTAIRALMKYGNEPVSKFTMPSLRILGSVGEPINPAAWEWYYHVVGRQRCAIVDTYWQTETGGIVMTPLPGVHPTKPGSCIGPFFGIEPVLLDEKTGEVKEGNDVKGILAIKRPWPSITRTVHGDHHRYLSVYMKPYPGYYFTGDGCYRDKDGYYWIIGRVDDVLNVSGHRIGTAELESALVQHESCAESAVIGFAHPIKGQGIFAFCILKDGYNADAETEQALKIQVRSSIGPFASPDVIAIVPGLPKTRSGKIMRRILRKIVEREFENLGDISTLAEPAVVQTLIDIVKTKPAPNASKL
eukprot:TRINITY_DN4623_c0_g1_i1.p1 TRINITY_DN4623_c0_g1~~TRINITY_DN4623_c0_g1_i1.p1  ORF type:complete len:666 (-),score=107.91 TRINITY_DN4623_c0_g1_i1:47-2044(-)